MLENKEQEIAKTTFGTVTDRRVRFLAKKGWFGGGAQEDLPLRHVTSVRLETSRRPILGIALLIAALALLAAAGVVKLLFIIPLALGILLLWGSPRVILNTAGGDLRPATGFPWTKADAQRFVSALRAQLFRE